MNARRVAIHIDVYREGVLCRMIPDGRPPSDEMVAQIRKECELASYTDGATLQVVEVFEVEET